MNDKPLKVAEAARSQLGAPYVFGAWGEYCTPDNRRRRERADHPTVKDKCQVLNGKTDNCNGCKWRGMRMFDCRGFTDWSLKQVGIDLYGDGATTQYNTAFNWAERGTIDNMPECVCCVFIKKDNRMEHTGLYLGGERTIECSNGVEEKPINKRWTHYAIPAGLYTAQEIEDMRGGRMKTLRYGDKGADVEKLQRRLNELGYNCGDPDGKFGNKTRNALIDFQDDYGLTPDGVCGAKTWEALGVADPADEQRVTLEELTRKVNDLEKRVAELEARK